MNPRFEIVRTDAGWHVRLLGGNGEKVMTSEVYTREETANEAIDLFLRTALAAQEGSVTTAYSDERTVQG